MTLKEELQQLILFELSEVPSVQRLFFDDSPDDLAESITPDEQLMLTYKLINQLLKFFFQSLIASISSASLKMVLRSALLDPGL